MAQGQCLPKALRVEQVPVGFVPEGDARTTG